MSMYEFDSRTEKPTVCLQVLPKRFVRIRDLADGDKKSVKDRPGNDGKVFFQPRTGVKTDPNTGKRTRVYDSGPGVVWVPPRIAKELTTVNQQEARAGVMPVATILETVEPGDAPKATLLDSAARPAEAVTVADVLASAAAVPTAAPEEAPPRPPDYMMAPARRQRRKPGGAAAAEAAEGPEDA